MCTDKYGEVRSLSAAKAAATTIVDMRTQLPNGIACTVWQNFYTVISEVSSGVEEVSGEAVVSGDLVVSSVRTTSASVTDVSIASYLLRATAKTAKAETMSAATETVMNATMRILVFILTSADKFLLSLKILSSKIHKIFKNV
jgi:pyruvate-formate lyase-activating enzyme